MAKSTFAHLRNHTDYSLLMSTIRIPELVDKTKACGMEHVAITDDGNLFGALEFYHCCRQRGINPIIGVDFYLSSNSRHTRGIEHDGRGQNYNRLVLLATSKEGYHNLVQLCSRGYLEGFYYKPRIDYDLLKQYNGGLIALVGGQFGDVGAQLVMNNVKEARRRLRIYRSIFDQNRLYLELQRHRIPADEVVINGLSALADEMSLPLVATNNCHYISTGDADAHSVLMNIGLNRSRGNRHFKFPTTEFYFKESDEMASLFNDFPEAIENSLRIAERCNIRLERRNIRFPDISLPKNFSTADDWLRHLSEVGCSRRYPNITQEISDRLKYELDTIISMGYTGYFLVVYDFISYAHKQNIGVGPGRGSGAGSIVAYCLGITNIDPLKYGLLFERFLNPERISMPDFDIDFSYERRGEVVRYVTEKYGAARVGQIITFGRLKAKAVMRDVARVLEMPLSEISAIVKLIPNTIGITLADALEKVPELNAIRSGSDKHKSLFAISSKLEGLCRHISTHAAGVVIGSEDLIEIIPLYRDPKSGAQVTQYAMNYLEELGLIKMDFLGLKTITLVEHTVSLIQESGKQIAPETIPENDPETFHMLAQGHSEAVFQFENQGMRKMLIDAKPNSFEDLIALISLYRPGPMEHIPKYIASKHGKQKISYPIDQLRNILDETYGVIVYQEQVMEIARTIAGFSLSQADIMRRAMGKKKQQDMVEMREKFVAGALENGIAKKDAVAVFDLMAPFAKYGFNKSHAAAYSVLSYQTAYLKCHYPRQFMAANLTNERDNPDNFIWYLETTRSMGIAIEAPQINRSQKGFSVVNDKIVYGFIAIKNVGENAVDEILRARKKVGSFESFSDFLEVVESNVLNRKILESLIQAGLFEGLGHNRATLLRNLDILLSSANAAREKRQTGQGGLFDDGKMLAADLEINPELDANQIWQYEYELLSCYFSGHPLDAYREKWAAIIASEQLDTQQNGVKILGIARKVKKISSSSGDFLTLTVECDRGSIEAVAYHQEAELYSRALTPGAILGLVARINKYQERTRHIIMRVYPLQEKKRIIKELHICLDAPLVDQAKLRELSAYLFDHRGKSAVYLHIEENKQKRVLRIEDEVNCSDESGLIEAIEQLEAINRAWIETR